MGRAPHFWYLPDPNWQAQLLRPLGVFWRWATARRVARRGYRSPLPVICVGNAVAGGAGKTPTVMAIAKALRQRGWQPVILSRGYGGKLTGPHHVTQNDDAQKVGDEALMHRRLAPTVIARNRAAGARLAERLGNVIIMDDGLQNPQLEKDFSILVIDGAVGLGNGLIVPAGPLREPVADVLRRVACTLVIGEGAGNMPKAARNFRGVIRPKTVPPKGPLIAFAGIARPEKFYQSLRDAGGKIIATRDFGDHETIPEPALASLNAAAMAEGARLITTEKDFVRLPAYWRNNVHNFRIALEIEAEFFDFLVASMPRL